jgi:hypothetical protein
MFIDYFFISFHEENATLFQIVTEESQLGLPSRTHGTPQGRKLQEHMKFLRVSPKG